MGFITGGPNEAIVVSGCCHGQPLIVVGGWVFVIPCVQKVQVSDRLVFYNLKDATKINQGNCRFDLINTVSVIPTEIVIKCHDPKSDIAQSLHSPRRALVSHGYSSGKNKKDIFTVTFKYFL